MNRKLKLTPRLRDELANAAYSLFMFADRSKEMFDALRRGPKAGPLTPNQAFELERDLLEALDDALAKARDRVCLTLALQVQAAMEHNANIATNYHPVGHNSEPIKEI